MQENRTAPAWQQGGSSTSGTTSASRGSTVAASRGKSGRVAATSARAAGSSARAANYSPSGAGTVAARRCARSFNPPRTTAEASTSQPTGNRPKRARYMSKRMEGYFYASGNY